MRDEPFALLPARTESTATISQCGLHRYDLTRTWGTNDEPNRKVVFGMLNPSKADAARPDPTMTRCAGFAEAWGFDGFAIVNLYGLRSTDPAALWKTADPIGPENERHLIRWATSGGLFVAAWGAELRAQRRGKEVLHLLAGLGVVVHAIRLTKGGSPEHPLYLPSRLKPFPLEYR